MINARWADLIAKHKSEDQKSQSFLRTILDASASTRASVVSACIGGVVIGLTVVVARPSFILTEPGCMYESPTINWLKVVCVFAFVASIMFGLDMHARSSEPATVAEMGAS